jgi:hypothetical protein
MARASVTGKLVESGIPLKKNKHYDARIVDSMLMEKTGSLLVKYEVTGSGDDKEFSSQGYEIQDFIELNLDKDFPTKTVESLVKKKTGSFFDAVGVDGSDFDTDELLHKNIAFMGYTKDDGYEVKFMINQYYHSQG